MIKRVEKLRKSIFSMALACLLVLPSATAFASTNGQATTLNELINKYNLEIVTTVPEGITPLKIDSIEDADLNFAAQEEKSDLKNESSPTINSQKSLKQANLITTNDVVSKTVTKDAGALNSDVSLSATCTYSSSGNQVVGISSVSSRLTGNTGNWGWSQSSYTSKSLDAGRTRGITVNGTLTQYVYINGQTVKYTSSKSGYFEVSY